jgi:cytoskeleton protein RodZ
MSAAEVGAEAPEVPSETAEEVGAGEPGVAGSVTAAEPVAPARPLTAGALLTQAREAAGMSRADVANKLKFSVKQIESVEADNYTALGGKTFVRGLVRTYAKLLELDAAPVLAALESSALPPETGQVVADPKGVPFPTAAPPGNPVVRYAMISIGVIALAILLLYWWHGEEFLGGPAASLPVVKPQAAKTDPAPDSGSAGAPTTVNLTPTVIDAAPVANPRGLATGATPAAIAPVITPANDKPAEKKLEKTADKAPEKAAPPLAQTAPPAAPAAAKGTGRRILMSFERDSWVEVKDAGGRIVFSQLNLGGTQQVIEGRAPFEVVIGNALYVNLRYRDAPVDLKPYIKDVKAPVARLSLN